MNTVLPLHPSVVLLMAGTNDEGGGFAVDRTVNNLKQIIAMLHQSSPQAVVYLHSVLPVRTNRSADFEPWAREVNQKLSTLADGHSIVFIDMHDDFLANGQMDRRFSDDGVHLNGAGYAIWQKRLPKALFGPLEH